MKATNTKEACNDNHCPFHSSFGVRGRVLRGKVVKLSAQKTIKIEFQRLHPLPKYERKEKRKTKLLVHSTPCIEVKLGDIVKVRECRPISKMKNFVVIENESIKR